MHRRCRPLLCTDRHAPAPRCKHPRLHRHRGASQVSGTSVPGAASCEVREANGKPHRGRRGRRSSRGRDQLAQGQRRRGACPHPKVFKEPGTRAPWVRPTTPPAAPSGQRAADVGRYGESSRAGPSVIGKLVCHVKTSPALASKPRGARYLDRGTTRWNSRAPARQGPSPEERHPVYPQRFNWFESTPRNAPRLPIQTNNHTN